MDKNLYLPSTYLRFWWYPRLIDTKSTLFGLMFTLVAIGVSMKLLNLYFKSKDK